MIGNSLNKNSAGPLFFIACVGVLFRLFFWLLIYPDQIPKGNFEPLYSKALNYHFWDYINYFHTKPIGILLMDKLILMSTIPENVAKLVVISCLDVSASMMFFHLIRSNFSSHYITLLVSIILSVSLFGWEFWRNANHFDHPNVFIFMLLSLTLYGFLVKPKAKQALLLGVCFFVLNLFHSVGFLISLGLIVILFINNRRKMNAFSISAVVCLTLFSLLPIAKNYAYYNVLAPSSVAGQNAFQLISENNPERVAAIISSATPPSWWKWCYEKALDLHPNMGIYPGIYGQCYEMSFTADTVNLNPMDLIEYLDVHHFNGPKAILAKDLMTAKNRPWLLAGGINESNTQFAIEYGKISNHMRWHGFKTDPLRAFYYMTKNTTKSLFDGPMLIGIAKYEPSNMTHNKFVTISGLFVGFLFMIGILAAIIWGLIYTPLIFQTMFSESTVMSTDQQFRYCLSFILLSVFFLLTVSTCCENSRMIFPLVGIALYLCFDAILLFKSFIKFRAFLS